jgi:hypothetical protein
MDEGIKVILLCAGIDGDAYDTLITVDEVEFGRVGGQWLADQLGGKGKIICLNGISGLSTQLCSGFAGVTASVTGAQNALSQQMYSNELASLNRSFAEQTANTAGFNGVQSSLCDIRYGNATNTRDILTALTAGVQSIKDQLCQDKIDAKNDEIAQLRQEVLYARGQASQDVQTARILAGQASEIDGVYNRLKNCPVPSMPVYGMQPVFTCQPQQSCGCGCGNGFAN